MVVNDEWPMTERLHAPSGRGDPFAAAVRATRMPMLVTDPKQPDNPIVFANDAFLSLTGYGRHEVLGRNCRFLQGEKTDPEAVAKIRDAITAEADVALDILNYRKDGTPFWNALYISPVQGDDGETLFFFASQLDVTERKNAEMEVREDRQRIEEAVQARTAELRASLEARTELLHELDHRVKNNLQMISALILLELRHAEHDEVRQSLSNVKGRVEALASVHRLLRREEDDVLFDLSSFLQEYAPETILARFQSELALLLDLEPTQVSSDHAAPVALIANELVTMAVRHRERSGCGEVRLSVRTAKEGQCRLCLEDDQSAEGVGASVDGRSKSFVDLLARQLGGAVHWQGEPASAHRICVDIPVLTPSNQHD